MAHSFNSLCETEHALRSAVRILLAGPNLVTHALQLLLQTKFDVVAVTSNASKLNGLCKSLEPDVVVIDCDFYLPDLHRVVADLQGSSIDMKLLFLCNDPQRWAFRRAMQAQVNGFALKDQDPKEFMAAIRAVAKGETYVAPPLREFLQWAKRVTPVATNKNLADLTSRQLQVLELIAQGLTGRQIADSLGITLKTVEYHRNLLKKALGVGSTAEITRYALQCGLIGPVY